MTNKNVVRNLLIVNDKLEKIQINYNLRPRNTIYYGEDGNFDDPTDDDYIFE